MSEPQTIWDLYVSKANIPGEFSSIPQPSGRQAGDFWENLSSATTVELSLEVMLYMIAHIDGQRRDLYAALGKAADRLAELTTFMDREDDPELFAFLEELGSVRAKARGET